jgi:hypothetical protein
MRGAGRGMWCTLYGVRCMPPELSVYCGSGGPIATRSAPQLRIRWPPHSPLRSHYVMRSEFDKGRIDVLRHICIYRSTRYIYYIYIYIFIYMYIYISIYIYINALVRRPVTVACSPWPRALRCSTPWRYPTPEEQGCGASRADARGVRADSAWCGSVGCAQFSGSGGVINMDDGAVTFKGGSIWNTYAVGDERVTFARRMSRVEHACNKRCTSPAMLHATRCGYGAY